MIFYLLLTILAIFFQGVFAFFEMACVSFNKVRLQYYVSTNARRALWLNYLLQRPSRLFGTTLIGITTSLVVGSECSRKVYEALNLSPDLAPLTQVPMVVIFGELAPLFAARRHPEQAAMALVPFMIVLARILAPLTWAFDQLSNLIHLFMGKKGETPLFLSRDEVRLAFEEVEGGQDEFHGAATQIFQMKSQLAGELMTPLPKVLSAPSHATVEEMRHLLSVHYAPIVPIYHRYPYNVVATVMLRDLLKLDAGKKVMDAARSPWFVTKETSVLQILQQFRRNNQSIAIVLDRSGHAVGILTLNRIIEQIFGGEGKEVHEAGGYIERTLSGEMRVEDFNRQFGAHLPEDHGDTLSELILDLLGHLPVKGESLKIQELEFRVEEPSILGIKTLSVHSVQE